MTIEKWDYLNEAQRNDLTAALTGDGPLSGKVWRRLGPAADATPEEWRASKVCADPRPADIDHAVAGPAALAHFQKGNRLGLYCGAAGLLVIDIDLKAADISLIEGRMMAREIHTALPAPLCKERGGPDVKAHWFWRANGDGGMIEVVRQTEDGEMVGGNLKPRNYVSPYRPSVIASALLHKDGHATTSNALAFCLNGRARVRGRMGGGKVRSLLNEHGLIGYNTENFVTILGATEEGERHENVRALSLYMHTSPRFDENDLEELKEAAYQLMPRNRWSEVDDLFRGCGRFEEKEKEDEPAFSVSVDYMEEGGASTDEPNTPANKPESRQNNEGQAANTAGVPSSTTTKPKPKPKAKGKTPPAKGRTLGTMPGSILASGAMVLEDAMTSRSLDMAMGHIGGKNAGFRSNVRTGKPEVCLGKDWQPMSDVIEGSIRDDIRLRCALVKEVKGVEISAPASFSVPHFRDAFSRLLCNAGDFDPFLAWGEGLKWDGVERIDNVLGRVFRLPDNEPVRYASRNLFLRAAMRAREPGCEADSAYIIQGAQSIGKTSWFEMLVPEDVLGLQTSPCASLSIEDALKTKWNTATETAGCVFLVLDELTGAVTANTPKVKEWLTRKDDSCRLPYERYNRHMPRRFIIVGTANAGAVLPDDPTGNRRWIVLRSPIPNGETIDFDMVRAEREMWWAESFAKTKGMTGLQLTEQEKQTPEVRAYFSNEAREVSDTSEAYERLELLLSVDGYKKLKDGEWDAKNRTEWGLELGMSRVNYDRDGKQVGSPERLTREAISDMTNALTHFGMEYKAGYSKLLGKTVRGFYFSIDKVADPELRRKISAGVKVTQPDGGSSPFSPSGNRLSTSRADLGY